MFSRIYNYISNLYYNSNIFDKPVKFNEETWIKNQLVLWQTNMYSANPHLQNIPKNMIDKKTEYFRKEYRKMFT